MIIEIPGQTRSKKNSKRILGRGKKKFIGASALYMKWAKEAQEWLEFKGFEPWPYDYPIEIKFFVYRENKRRFDWDNIICGSLDVLQQTKIIKQDDMVHVIPVISGWAVDKHNPRVILKLQSTSREYFREDLCKYE